MKWKKSLLFLASGLILVMILFPMHVFGALYVLLSFISGEGKVTETTDIADYGIITGNYYNDRPAEFMFSFFPEEISEDFSNVSYHYKAQKGDTYACEIWLEFDIQDKTKFAEFIDASVDPEQVTTFSYDPSLSDYTVSNNFILTSPEDDAPDAIHIEYAEIGKILYNEESQHVICYALLMCDGGYSSTREFGRFFTRFKIDPIQYEIDAYDDTYYEENGTVFIR
jgi:hypothetical protein